MENYLKRINPIIRSVNNIVDFSDISNSQFLSEYPYLQQLVKYLYEDIHSNIKTLEQLEKLLLELEIEIKSYVGADKSDSFGDYNQTKKSLGRKVVQINECLEQITSPYFGKIVFNRKADKTFPSGKITTYIGKHAYFDKELNRPLVTDWRAPITNLYYSNGGPTKNVYFVSPAGTQSGDLESKMQYEITMGRIKSVYNSQTGNNVADEFLLSQLNKKLGKKLTDIISTIQDQQNNIIRDSIEQPMIIQGVAGSGKTTILLHRISYLLYAHKNCIKSENSLIIAPNKLFLDYISEILPSLGVELISQTTFISWAKSILGWKSNYLLSAQPDNLEIIQFKGSVEFIRIMNSYLESLEEIILDNIPDPLAIQISKRYFELKSSQPTLSIFERLNYSVQYAFAQIQYKFNSTGSFYGSTEHQGERERNINQYLKKNVNIYKIYKHLFSSDSFLNNSISKQNSQYTIEFLKSVKDYSHKTLISQNSISFYKAEDLAGLLWIYQYIYGTKNIIKDYIAIDEAQDMSVFQLICLIKTARNYNVSLAGDLAQSIIPPFNITDWSVLIMACEEFLKTEVKYHQLDKCYRTTIEIIEYANNIIRGKFPATYKLPEAVLRHGDPVTNITLSGTFENQSISENDINALIDLLINEDKKGFSTLAIICKNKAIAYKAYEKLSNYKARLPRKLHSDEEENFDEGILILPIEKAKGLEFDSVVIVDYTSDSFTNSFLDTKLFYVAVTRALHRLHILTS